MNSTRKDSTMEEAIQDEDLHNSDQKTKTKIKQKTKPVKPSQQRKFFVFDRDDTLATKNEDLINPQAMIPLIKTICTSDNLGWGIASVGGTDEAHDFALLAIKEQYKYPLKRKPSYVRSVGGASTIANYVVNMIDTKNRILAQKEEAQKSLQEILTSQKKPSENTKYKLLLPNHTVIVFDPYVLTESTLRLWSEGNYKLMAVLIALDEAHLRPIHNKKFRNKKLANLGIVSIDAPNSFATIEMQDVIFVDDKKENCYLVRAAGCVAINADTDAVTDPNRLEDPNQRNTYIRKIYDQLPATAKNRWLQALSEVEKKRWLEQELSPKIEKKRWLDQELSPKIEQERLKSVWIKQKFGPKLYEKLTKFEEQIFNLENKPNFDFSHPEKFDDELNENIVTQLKNLQQKLVNEILNTKEKNINNTPYPIILDHFTHLTKQHIKKPLTQAQIQKSCDDLDKKLNSKPNIAVRTAICGVIGAFIGFTVGFVIGAVVTSWSGGWGALPAAILTAIGCYNLGAAIGSGLGAMGGFVIPSIVGFFHSKAKKKEFDERRKNMSENLQNTVKDTYTSFGLSRKTEEV